MPAYNFKGITVEIGGDTKNFNTALSELNGKINNSSREIGKLNRLLKLDPTNTVLLAQKQELLSKEIAVSKDKLSALQQAKKAVDANMQNGTEVDQEEYRKLCREIESTTKNIEIMTSTYDGLAGAGEAATKTLSERISAVGDKMQTIGDGISSVGKALAPVSAAVAGAGVAGVKLAADFEDAFAKVSTLLDESSTDFDAYKADIMAASTETGVSVNDFSEAVYSAISASVDAGDAVDFTTAAVKLAKGGFTDTAKAVDVMTTAINGYQLQAEDASKISDLLITTQNEGKTTVDELASSMGKVIPVAAAANYDMTELSSAYALLTKNGIATAESGTYLKSMLNELTKSGSTTDTTLRELTGKGFADLKAEGNSTSDILNMLSDAAAKDGKTLKDMFSSVEGGSAAMVLARNSGSDYNEILQTMEQSAGATDTAFAKVTNTTSQKFAKALNELKNNAIDLMDNLLPAITQIIEGISGLVQKFSGLDESTQKVILTVGGIIAVLSPVLLFIGKLVSSVGSVLKAAPEIVSTVGKVKGAISGLFGLLSGANPVVLIVAGIAALVVAFVTLWNKSEAFRNFWIGLWEAIKSVVSGAISGIQGFLAGMQAGFSAAWNAIQTTVSTVVSAIASGLQAAWAGITGAASTALSAMGGGLNHAANHLADVAWPVDVACDSPCGRCGGLCPWAQESSREQGQSHGKWRESPVARAGNVFGLALYQQGRYSALWYGNPAQLL